MRQEYLHKYILLILFMKNGMLTLLFVFASGFSLNNFSRIEFYHVFEEGSLDKMEDLSLQINEIKELEAYRGAILMKMSGLQKNTSTKLKTFKSGKLLLESSISANPNNTEWRFLRFMVQENTPKVVKYRGNLVEDKSEIINNFNAFDKKLQSIIKKYAQKSILLNLDDLPN